MLTGFLYGIAAAFFWSLTNIIDKHLTNRHASDGNVWAIVVLSCFFPACMLPIALHFSDVHTSLANALYLMTAGALMVGWIYFYLKALTEDDTSIVMTLLVLAPFFSLVFSAIILGEMLTPIQLTAGAFLVLGSLVVSYDHSEGGGLKTKLLFYAIAASTIMGLMHSLFKLGSEESDIWLSIFWRSAGMVLTGFILCLLISDIRNRFYDFMTTYVKSGLTLNSANESLTLVGDTLFGLAILVAPIALIQTTEAYQPIFILLISFLLSQLGINSVEEDYSRAALARKFVGIAAVIVGSFILVWQ